MERELRRERLIQELDALREEWGWTHTAFASYLGISLTGWSLMRRGIRQPSDGSLLRILLKHPELRPHIAVLADAA